MIIDVTVVIATRDRAPRLRGTLERLTALPERPPVIVVDNASTDATAAVAAGFGPRVRLVRLPRNAGAGARNVGALARAGELLRTHPRLALIAASTLVGPAEVPDPMSVDMASAPLGRGPDLPGPSVLGFLACAAVVRRAAFQAVGGFDPIVFFMGEEARLTYDLAAAGWGLAHCADVVAHHHPETGNGGCATKRALARRNAVRTAWMRRPVRTALAGTGALIAAARSDPAARRARRQLVRRLPGAVRRRHRPAAEVERALARLTAAPRHESGAPKVDLRIS